MILLVYTAGSWALEVPQLGRREGISWVVKGFGIRKTLMSWRQNDGMSRSVFPISLIIKLASYIKHLSPQRCLRCQWKLVVPDKWNTFSGVCRNSQHAISHDCFCGLGSTIWDELKDAQRLTQFWNMIFWNQWPCLTKWSFPYAFLFWGYFFPPTGRKLSITFQIWLLFHLLFEKVAAGNNNWNKIISDKWLFPAHVPEEIINSCSVRKSSMLTLILLCFLLPTNILDCASKAFIVQS